MKKPKRTLGPLAVFPCLRCGKKHFDYTWPKKCYEFALRQERAEESAFDRKAYTSMSQAEKDAHDNL